MQVQVQIEETDYPFFSQYEELFTGMETFKPAHQDLEENNKDVTITVTFADANRLNIYSVMNGYQIDFGYPEPDGEHMNDKKSFTCTVSSASPLLFFTHLNGEESLDSEMPIIHDTEEYIDAGLTFSKSLLLRELQKVRVRVDTTSRN